MTWTYDINTYIGKVRNLIDDTVEVSALMFDEEIDAIIVLKNNDLLGAAAICLMRIASNKALLAKKIAAGDYSEDLSAIAKELMALAKAYLSASAEDAEALTAIPADAQAEIITTDFSYREILRNQALRGEEY